MLVFINNLLLQTPDFEAQVKDAMCNPNGRLLMAQNVAAYMAIICHWKRYCYCRLWT